MSLQENTQKLDELQMLFEDVIQVQVPNAEPFVYGHSGVSMFKLQEEDCITDIRRVGANISISRFKKGVMGCRISMIRMDGSSDPHEEIQKHIKGK